MPSVLDSSWFRKFQLRTMGNLVADCVGVPRQPMPSLETFGQFSAQCAKEAAARPDGGASARAQLTAKAFQLGRMLMRTLGPLGMSPNDVAKALYKNIDITLVPDLPHGVTVPRCAFCAWYGPEECAFMSAFDQGILCGLANQRDLQLQFQQRLTQDHPCCKATLESRDDPAQPASTAQSPDDSSAQPAQRRSSLMKTAIVVGAGAGGIACAVQLAQSGQYQVTLLEAGGDFSRFALDSKALEPMRKAGLFLDPRMISILFGDMRVAKSKDMVHVWGRGIGGTTNLATGNGVRYDKDLAALGIDLDEEFEEIYQVVPVSTDHEKHWSAETHQAFDACEELGFNPAITPKLTHPGKCCNCGRCVFGCPFGAKWTSTDLLDLAPEGSITVRKHAVVERINLVVERSGNGENAGQTTTRAKGVTLKGGKTLEADLVVIAAGGINTPRILEASGFACQPSFYGDPVLCVATELPNVKQDVSLPMPFVAQRDGYILSPYFDQLSFFFDKNWRKPSHDIFSLMIKFEDDACGSITPNDIEKTLTPHDYETLSRAVDDCYAIFEKMGVAKEDTFFGLVNEGHPGGTLPLTAETAATLHHEMLPSNVYVADPTLFPKSMGNPPILTIMALAKKVAKTICAKDIEG